jgi:hypothetical protein
MLKLAVVRGVAISELGRRNTSMIPASPTREGWGMAVLSTYIKIIYSYSARFAGGLWGFNPLVCAKNGWEGRNV